MSEFPSRLPARPSLEQLHKQAKELLRQYHAGDAGAAERLSMPSPRLADAQFVLAREYGFESWAKLKHHVEAGPGAGLEKFERLAKDLATAYSAGDAMAIREINWSLGTSFVWDREPEQMQRRLSTWFASENRTPELALADARNMVAHSYGFASWAKFEESAAQPPADPRSAPVFLSSTPPFYKIDWKDNALSVRGPQSEKDWDTIFSVMKEHQIAKLDAGGISDSAMEKLPRLEHVTQLHMGGSQQLTDAGFKHLARMPQLQDLNMRRVEGLDHRSRLEALRPSDRTQTHFTCAGSRMSPTRAWPTSRRASIWKASICGHTDGRWRDPCAGRQAQTPAVQDRGRRHRRGLGRTPRVPDL